jgi:hypothetical protein
MENIQENSPQTAMRLDYANKCFQNMQELIRFMDQKAGFVLAAVGILSAALGSLVTNIFQQVPTNPTQAALRVVSQGLLVAYLLIAFLVIWVAVRVFTARPNTLAPDTTAPGLIFPLILLKKFKSDEMLYAEKLGGMTTNEILHDYANQIMEIANIYQVKQKYVNQSIHLFQWSSILWLATVLAALVMFAIG